MASSPKARDTEPPSSLDETGTMEASTVGNTVLVSSIPATISASALVEILSSVAGVVIPQGAAEKKQGDQPSDGGGPPQLQLVQLMQEPSVETTVQEVVQQEEVKSGRKSGNKKDKTGKQPWHYHLGGVRHCRVPLSPELKEALEVAYVSRIMSKNFRKEGQPEKERISMLTGLELDKVQEWFKNRRKKDKLIQSRVNSTGTPKGKRGRKLLLPHSAQKHKLSEEPNGTNNTENQEAAEP